MGALPKEILECFGAITGRKIGKVNQSDCPCDGIYIKAPKPNQTKLNQTKHFLTR